MLRQKVKIYNSITQILVAGSSLHLLRMSDSTNVHDNRHEQLISLMKDKHTYISTWKQQSIKRQCRCRLFYKLPCLSPGKKVNTHLLIHVRTY